VVCESRKRSMGIEVSERDCKEKKKVFDRPLEQ